MNSPIGVDPWQWWTTLQPQARLLAALLQLLVGLAVTFFGFRLFRALLAVAGFAAGASFAVSLTSGGALPAGTWLLALALGLLGALVLWALFRIGALLAGAALGLAVAGGVAASLPPGTNVQWDWLLLLVGLVLGAVLAWRLQRPLIIVVTALVGAWASMVGLAMALGRVTPTQAVPAALGTDLWTLGPAQAWQGEGRVWLLGTLALAVLGVAFQVRDTLRMRNRRF
ncbi:MAG: DUF4203 domain-containing protein [Deinococcales bacterium]|jgi:hypothetical protein